MKRVGRWQAVPLAVSERADDDPDRMELEAGLRASYLDAVECQGLRVVTAPVVQYELEPYGVDFASWNAWKDRQEAGVRCALVDAVCEPIGASK